MEGSVIEFWRGDTWAFIQHSKFSIQNPSWNGVCGNGTIGSWKNTETGGDWREL